MKILSLAALLLAVVAVGVSNPNTPWIGIPAVALGLFLGWFLDRRRDEETKQ